MVDGVLLPKLELGSSILSVYEGEDISQYDQSPEALILKLIELELVVVSSASGDCLTFTVFKAVSLQPLLSV